MKPTVQAPDFYKIGNDYVQAPLSSFYDMTPLTLEEAIARGNSALEGEPKYYQDGIYTKLAADLAAGDYSAAPFKNPEGFNKRRVFVDNADADLPEGVVFNTEDTNKVQPAVDEEQYGKGDIIATGAGEEA